MATEFDKKFDQFWSLRKWLHEYFGYNEDWVTIPMSDERDKWWFIRGAEDDTGRGGEVVMQYQPDEDFDPKLVEDGQCVCWNIYTQRFLPKWIYRGAEYTMVCCATGVDGNKYLGIFSNDQEVPAELLDPNAKTSDEEIRDELRRRGLLAG
jgi:hypothetical protein